MTHLPPFPALFELPSKSSQIITFIQKSNKPKQQWHIWLINLATFFWKTKKRKRKEEDLLIETNYAIQKKHKNPSRTHKTRKKEHIAASRILVPFYSWKKKHWKGHICLKHVTTFYCMIKAQERGTSWWKIFGCIIVNDKKNKR